MFDQSNIVAQVSRILDVPWTSGSGLCGARIFRLLIGLIMIAIISRVKPKSSCGNRNTRGMRPCQAPSCTVTLVHSRAPELADAQAEVVYSLLLPPVASD